MPASYSCWEDGWKEIMVRERAWHCAGIQEVLRKKTVNHSFLYQVGNTTQIWIWMIESLGSQKIGVLFLVLACGWEQWFKIYLSPGEHGPLSKENNRACGEESYLASEGTGLEKCGSFISASVRHLSWESPFNHTGKAESKGEGYLHNKRGDWI